MTDKRHDEIILIVDDSPDQRELLKRNLKPMGFQVYTASNVKEALNILENTKIDLVITDLKMPEVSGLDLVRHVRDNLKNTEVMMITGYPSIESAVEAVKAGADDYLAKPFTNEELFGAVEKALEKLKMKRAGITDSEEVPQHNYGLLGESEPVIELRKTIAKTAKTSATVLITGDSGTGKELVARAIHYNSPRASSPFIPVNCGGIPETLLESELFGHVKGAFTGASESRAGFFQTADGGSIFLDEISETSSAMQVKLLRVLQEKEVYMVGATKSVRVDVRIIAATNKELQNLVKKNLFREDLYFRLNVINIAIPPLKDRGDDVIILAKHFVKKYSEEYGMKPFEFTDKALQTLRHYHWQGNVRELQNMIQSIVVMSESEVIDVSDLPPIMRFSAMSGSGYTRTLEDVEAEYINNVLQSVQGNKTRAAEILGIDRKTLREKLKKYSLDSDE
jgi:two-component system response regulator HydG